MKVLVIGTVLFSLRVLNKLIDLNTDIIGVCTKEDSHYNSDFADLTPLCIEKKIPCFLIQSINSQDCIDWIKNLQPDVILCIGLSQLIGKEILSIPPLGVIGYHPTLLPKNRGRHPIIWALALGLPETGSTFFFMDEGADSGDILSQKVITIDYTDDANTLYTKLEDCALEQIEKFLPQLSDGSYKHVIIKQKEAESNTWRKRGILDGVVDFRMSSFAVYNLVRALTHPYVGAHILYKDSIVKIWRVEEVDLEGEFSNIEPGKILFVAPDKIMVKTYDGAVNILQHEFKILPKVGEYL
ncbi:formyltransferase family protein [Treponema pedis]|uniref:Methionyl-tRNA formyltransferase n=1 Tax=Treponema pedis str. T A4 TaxID=1291379 RepID=S5ZJH5_9SPIR|nr:formyltransferase family protein [Treponema pedis]AGT42692.1 methionyl-tRNA formyltransferase [Treponema pedis str. T A4]QSI03577.1 methionyl-tRNA formyltransferase [Treponema pedis]